MCAGRTNTGATPAHRPTWKSQRQICLGHSNILQRRITPGALLGRALHHYSFTFETQIKVWASLAVNDCIVQTRRCSKPVICKKTSSNNLESKSAIFSEFYAALMQLSIKANGDCVFSTNSAVNQLALYQKGSFKIPALWKSLTAEKFAGCELKIERNVCHPWLTNENMAGVAQT